MDPGPTSETITYVENGDSPHPPSHREWMVALSIYVWELQKQARVLANLQRDKGQEILIHNRWYLHLSHIYVTLFGYAMNIWVGNTPLIRYLQFCERNPFLRADKHDLRCVLLDGCLTFQTIGTVYDWVDKWVTLASVRMFCLELTLLVFASLAHTISSV